MSYFLGLKYQDLLIEREDVNQALSRIDQEVLDMR
jgi:Ubiquinol-cytochrome C reductase complex 14kD subunit